MIDSVCGNIYKERFSDQGKRYTNYYADCALCDTETGIFFGEKGHRCSTFLKNSGWIKIGKKWICDKCAESMK